LFGRTGELEILGQLIADVRSGQSAVLVVRGKPGTGKTELLRYLWERLRRSLAANPERFACGPAVSDPFGLLTVERERKEIGSWT
jgi:predicted ATPase